VGTRDRDASEKTGTIENFHLQQNYHYQSLLTTSNPSSFQSTSVDLKKHVDVSDIYCQRNIGNLDRSYPFSHSSKNNTHSITKIDEMAGDLDGVKSELVELKTQIDKLSETAEKERESSTHYGPVPKEVKVCSITKSR
jgi:hypothetical protein